MSFPSLKIKDNSSKSGDVVQKIILITALVLFITGGAYLYFIAPGQEVELEILLPEDQLFAGDIFEVEVALSNNSQGDIENTRLSLSLPEGIKLLDAPERVNEVKDIGQVKRGQVLKEKYVLVALPSDNKDGHQLKAKANYFKNSLSADFESNTDKKIKLEEISFNLQIDTPDTIFTNQQFQIKAIYDGPEIKEGPGIFFVLEGENFTILASNPSSSGEGNRWNLHSGDGQTIEISSKVTQKTTDVQKIIGKIVLEFNGEDYILEQKELEVLLAPSPLTFSISLADPKEFASLGEQLNYTISYQNNTDTDLQNVSIEAEVIGDMFDFNSLQTEGGFNQLTKTVTWDSGSFNILRSVKRGDQGSFNMRIKVKEKFPSYTLSDRNFVLKVKALLESPTVAQGSDTDRTTNTKTLETKVAGNLSIDAKAYFRDAASKVVNSGPLPPRVGVPTQYTVHWVISGLGTDLKNIEARSTLPAVAKVDSFINSNIGKLSALQDGENTQIVWSIESISATNLLQGEFPEAIMQISVLPTSSMIGQYAPILGLTTVSALDAFTNIDLLDTDSPLNTQLLDDSTVGINEGKVIM